MTTSRIHLPASPAASLPRQRPRRHRREEYTLRLATGQADVIAAQTLRHESDRFDDLCDHLIVWHHGPGRPAAAVATYRLLPPHGNDHQPRSAGLYADQEFGLMPLESILDRTVEVGRACVRADHRGGPAIGMLWRGIASYLALTGCRYLLGCASMPLSDGGRSAASFWDLALREHLAPAHRRCRPRNPVPIGRLPRADAPSIPRLLAGYLRMGARVCGPPAYDEMFGTADFLLLLDLGSADRQYLERFSPVGGRT